MGGRDWSIGREGQESGIDIDTTQERDETRDRDRQEKLV
jgi:hypothetical protein